MRLLSLGGLFFSEGRLRACGSKRKANGGDRQESGDGKLLLACIVWKDNLFSIKQKPNNNHEFILKSLMLLLPCNLEQWQTWSALVRCINEQKAHAVQKAYGPEFGPWVPWAPELCPLTLYSPCNPQNIVKINIFKWSLFLLSDISLYLLKLYSIILTLQHVVISVLCCQSSNSHGFTVY